MTTERIVQASPIKTLSLNVIESSVASAHEAAGKTIRADALALLSIQPSRLPPKRTELELLCCGMTI